MKNWLSGFRRTCAIPPLLALAITIPLGAGAGEVDPAAVELLQASMEHLSGLQTFSVSVKNLHEDMLETGHRVDFESVASVTVQRPDKLRGERHGVGVQQVLYFDGTNITLHNPPDNVYATEQAPGTIEDMFQFSRDTLGLYVPITDLLWADVFPLLMHEVDYAIVVDKEIIDGVTCDHLLFSRPGVDFQIWIADDGTPWPLKYVVTDTGTPELLSIVTTLSDWNDAPKVSVSMFTFVPPEGTKMIPFLKFDIESGLDR